MSIFNQTIGGVCGFSIKRFALISGLLFGFTGPNYVLYVYGENVIMQWFTFYTFFINIIVGGYYGGKYIDNKFSIQHKEVDDRILRGFPKLGDE